MAALMGAVIGAVMGAVILAPASALAGDLGPYTGKPLPRFAALKADKVHLRKGPGRDYAIDWVLQRRAMPVLIYAEHYNWRRVRLMDGTTGWIHRAMLNGRRMAAAMADDTLLREHPDESADPIAKAAAGSVLALGRCEGAWCQVEAEGHRGWSLRASLWGAQANPTR